MSTTLWEGRLYECSQSSARNRKTSSSVPFLPLFHDELMHAHTWLGRHKKKFLLFLLLPFSRRKKKRGRIKKKKPYDEQSETGKLVEWPKPGSRRRGRQHRSRTKIYIFFFLSLSVWKKRALWDEIERLYSLVVRVAASIMATFDDDCSSSLSLAPLFFFYFLPPSRTFHWSFFCFRDTTRLATSFSSFFWCVLAIDAAPLS